MKRRIAITIALAACVGAPARADARMAKGPPTCEGRYAVEGDGLASPRASIPMGDVVLSQAGIELEGWCRLATVRVAQRKNGRLDVRGRFKRCGPLGSGRLKMATTRLCDTLAGTVKLRAAKGRWRFQAGRRTPRTERSTFDLIEERIFTGRCSLATCHGPGLAGGLDLRAGAAFDALVGAPAANLVAAAAGRVRVVPGSVDGSFLSAKLHGRLGPGEGGRMPLERDPLGDAEIALVDAWIAAGAPRTGIVEDAPPPPPPPPPGGYEETPPLPAPPNGWQLYLEGPVLQPGEEQEGCLWVPSPVPADVPIKKIEVALNPGTHHYAVWVHGGGAPPPTNVWLANDVACIASGATFGQSIGGAPGAPYFVSETPPGIATRLPGTTYLGLNAHYYNEFDVPIRVRVWTNFHAYEGTPEHFLKTIQDTDTIGRIHVPPNSQATVQGRFTNTTGRTMFITGVAGHMHKRGLRFSIWDPSGTKVLDDYDWAHPTFKAYLPPFELAPGESFTYECLHDNGVTRPLRRDDDGDPMTITFGISAEDEMCILTGSYYDD